MIYSRPNLESVRWENERNVYISQWMFCEIDCIRRSWNLNLGNRFWISEKKKLFPIILSNTGSVAMGDETDSWFSQCESERNTLLRNLLVSPLSALLHYKHRVNNFNNNNVQRGHFFLNEDKKYMFFEKVSEAKLQTRLVALNWSRSDKEDRNRVAVFF